MIEMAAHADKKPFEQLNNALENLFKTYDALQDSLESLSKNVCNIAIDARDQAVKINVLGKTTHYNLVFYLKSLNEMASAMLDMDSDKSKSEATTARFTINSRLNPEAGVDNAMEMLNEFESVIEILREREKNKQQSQDTGMDKEIEKATNGASSIIKEITLRLLGYIKEEMKKAVDDSTILTNSTQLETEVQAVKKTIEQTEKSYSENISALGNIISTIDGLLVEDNSKNNLISLKENAKTLEETCTTKLSNIERPP